MHRLSAVVLFLVVVASVSAQQNQPVPTRLPDPAAVALPEGPFEFTTAEHPRIRVEVVTRELSHPWGLVFLPDGGILVTERGGTIRVIRDGVLDPAPVLGVPEVFTGVRLAGMMDIALHPEFAENQLVYVTYSQPAEEDGRKGARVALGSGPLRWDGYFRSPRYIRRHRVEPGDRSVSDCVRAGRAVVYEHRWGDQCDVDRAARSGSGQSLREAAASARRRKRPRRQSVRRPARLCARALLNGTP